MPAEVVVAKTSVQVEFLYVVWRNERTGNVKMASSCTQDGYFQYW